jgi:hypothetical protein
MENGEWRKSFGEDICKLVLSVNPLDFDSSCLSGGQGNLCLKF